MTYTDEVFILCNFPSGCLPGTLVQSLVKNLEKQLETPVKKPTGGVNLFLMPSAGLGKAPVQGRTPQVGCWALAGCPAISNRASSEFGGRAEV